MNPCIERTTLESLTWRHVSLTRRLQRPTASCNNIVAQVQRQDGENTDAYNLRLRETSSAARMLQAVPSAAVMSQFMMPIQVRYLVCTLTCEMKGMKKCG
jgi:hypothetical protein